MQAIPILILISDLGSVIGIVSGTLQSIYDLLIKHQENTLASVPNGLIRVLCDSESVFLCDTAVPEP